MAYNPYSCKKIFTFRSDVVYNLTMAKSKYPIEAKTLGEKIRKRRLDKELTLIEVAEEIGISESYLARIEADKQIPLREVAEKLEKELGADVGEYSSHALSKYYPKNLGLRYQIRDFVALIKHDTSGRVGLEKFSLKDKKAILNDLEDIKKNLENM